MMPSILYVQALYDDNNLNIAHITYIDFFTIYNFCFVCSKGMAELDVVHIKRNVCILIILPFLIIFCLIRDLKSLSFLSWFANIVTVIVLISIYQYFYGHLKPPSELEEFSAWGKLPLFFGACTFAFEAIPIVSSTYKI